MKNFAGAKWQVRRQCFPLENITRAIRGRYRDSAAVPVSELYGWNN